MKGRLCSMSVNDRGTMKWTSLMLPEQVEMLRDLSDEMNRKDKPILDEQQIAENEFKLRGALDKKLSVKITYFVDHDYHEIKGHVNSIRKNIIYIEETEILFGDIIEVDFLDSIFDDY